MVKNRVGNKIVVRPQRSCFPVMLIALLICGVVLLLEGGCQKPSGTNAPAVGASSGVIPSAQAKPAQPAKSEKAPATTPAATPAASQAQAASGTPKIEFKTTAQNFGDIGPETTHTTKFEFKNAGNAPLKILGIKSCCGSVTRGVKVGQEFAPGQSGALEVEYRTATYPGPLVRNLSMNTNDPNQPIANLTIKANVVYRIEHYPNRLNLFGKKENAGCGPITLKSTDGKPFSISGFRTTANVLTAAFDPNVKATEFVLQPKVDLEKLAHNPKGQISINLTHPECANVLIQYDLVSEFTVTPQQLTLFNIKANEPIQRELWVLSNYDEDFEIESISSQRGAIKAIDTKKVPGVAGDSGKTGARYQVRIEITPPAMDDKRSILSDVLEIKLKGSDTLTVQCRGFYAAK